MTSSNSAAARGTPEAADESGAAAEGFFRALNEADEPRFVGFRSPESPFPATCVIGVKRSRAAKLTPSSDEASRREFRNSALVFSSRKRGRGEREKGLSLRYLPKIVIKGGLGGGFNVRDRERGLFLLIFEFPNNKEIYL